MRYTAEINSRWWHFRPTEVINEHWPPLLSQMSGKYWLNWQQVSMSWLRITDHALPFLCFPSEFWIAFCCRISLNHVAHTELQTIWARAWVRNALTLIQDGYDGCRLPLLFSMPKLTLHALLAGQEVPDKQCLHVVQSSLPWGHGQQLAPLSDPAQTSFRDIGQNCYKSICQEGCNVLFDRAQTGYQLVKQKFSLNQPPQKSDVPLP